MIPVILVNSGGGGRDRAQYRGPPEFGRAEPDRSARTGLNGGPNAKSGYDQRPEGGAESSRENCLGRIG